VLGNHWIMAGHAAQIPTAGDFFLFDVGGESIILVRGAGGAIHAHYNVCRHRGSRVLLECAGHAASLTCRYHGWSYAPDGRLRAAPHMPADFEPETHGLIPCHVQVLEGLILISLAREAPDLGAIAEGATPFLRPARHGRRTASQSGASFPLRELEVRGRELPRVLHCRVAASGVLPGGDQGGPHRRQRLPRRRPGSRRAFAPGEPAQSELGTTLPEFGTELPLDERLPRAQFGAAYRAPLRETHLPRRTTVSPRRP
jgi:nitrite reductase/ring-hydroxylating ferredoxin subunit